MNKGLRQPASSGVKVKGEELIFLNNMEILWHNSKTG